MHAVLSPRRERLGQQVVDRRAVLEREERVPEALADIDRTTIDGVDPYDVVLAERRGSDPKVDDDVEAGSGDAGHVLRLAGRDLGEVDAAQHAAGGHRAVHLGQLERVAEHVGHPVGAVPLEEQTPRDRRAASA